MITATWRDVRIHAVWLVVSAAAALLLAVSDTPTTRWLVGLIMVASLCHLVYWTVDRLGGPHDDKS